MSKVEVDGLELYWDCRLALATVIGIVKERAGTCIEKYALDSIIRAKSGAEGNIEYEFSGHDFPDDRFDPSLLWRILLRRMDSLVNAVIAMDDEDDFAESDDDPVLWKYISNHLTLLYFITEDLRTWCDTVEILATEVDRSDLQEIAEFAREMEFKLADCTWKICNARTTLEPYMRHHPTETVPKEVLQKFRDRLSDYQNSEARRRALIQDPGATAASIARELGCARSEIVKVIQKLEDTGTLPRREKYAHTEYTEAQKLLIVAKYDTRPEKRNRKK